MNRLEKQRQPLLMAVAAIMLAAVVLAAYRLGLDQASVLGIVVVFALVVLTSYYWVMLLMVPLGRGRWMPTAGWLAINTALFGLHLATPSFEMIYGILSWALAIFFLAWLAPDAITSLREFRQYRELRVKSKG